MVHLEDGSEMTWKREGEEVDRDAVLASLADEDVDLQEVNKHDRFLYQMLVVRFMFSPQERIVFAPASAGGEMSTHVSRRVGRCRMRRCG